MFQLFFLRCEFVSGGCWRGSTPKQIYYKQLSKWSENEKILTFVFEAFDEPWKGSSDPKEPEKHWGLYTVDRAPKLAMQPIGYK